MPPIVKLCFASLHSTIFLIMPTKSRVLSTGIKLHILFRLWSWKRLACPLGKHLAQQCRRVKMVALYTEDHSKAQMPWPTSLNAQSTYCCNLPCQLHYLVHVEPSWYKLEQTDQTRRIAFIFESRLRPIQTCFSDGACFLASVKTNSFSSALVIFTSSPFRALQNAWAWCQVLV